MKRFLAAALIATLSLTLQARDTQSINEGWSYKSMKQKDWAPFIQVTLPHTWNAEYLDGTRDYNRETMVYRRDLPLHDISGKRVFLLFEGANSTATLFVNRHSVTEHLGGYTAFCNEITDFVSEGDNARKFDT